MASFQRHCRTDDDLLYLDAWPLGYELMEHSIGLPVHELRRGERRTDHHHDHRDRQDPTPEHPIASANIVPFATYSIG
jgi:hypothetical protein